MTFDSRQQAGKLLGEELQRRGTTVDVVVGLARGGVVVAAEVARILKIPLEVMIVRKIGAPGSPEFAVGAVAEDTVWWDEETIRRFGLSEEWRKEQVEIKRKEVEEYRKKLFETIPISRVGRRSKSGLNEASRNSLSSLPVSIILVDDGAATGTSMIAAIRGLRDKGQGTREEKKIIVALPVASTEAAGKFRELADGVVLLEEGSFLSSVGQYYRDFSQVEWEEVRRLLEVSDTSKPSP